MKKQKGSSSESLPRDRPGKAGLRLGSQRSQVFGYYKLVPEKRVELFVPRPLCAWSISVDGDCLFVSQCQDPNSHTGTELIETLLSLLAYV